VAVEVWPLDPLPVDPALLADPLPLPLVPLPLELELLLFWPLEPLPLLLPEWCRAVSRGIEYSFPAGPLPEPGGWLAADAVDNGKSTEIRAIAPSLASDI
jgi:hypothetical protein